MSYEVSIVADSIAPHGGRITTFQLKYPRMIHAEFMTHRAMCLAGDSVLEFDLPGGSRGHRRAHKMRIDEFVRKWHDGANRTVCKPKRQCDLAWIDEGHEYSSPEIAARLGMANPANINSLCRAGAIQAHKGERGEWLILGREIVAWRSHTPDHSRFDMKARLSAMRIRQLNEDTGDIQFSSVLSACESGVKDVFEVRAGEFQVAGSADHRVMTADGWKPIKSIRPGEIIVVRRFGKKADERLDPLRLNKFDGVWRSRWQAQIRKSMSSEDQFCRRCRRWHGTEIHHIVPVHEDPSRALDESNVTLLCGPCHTEMHSAQGWQGGTHLYGAMAKVDEIVFRGTEATFDLEIAGPYPNFLANGVVVHNSRNASSTRAIPTARMIEWIEQDPAMPVYWGKNQKGMQATEELTDYERETARKNWLYARDMAVERVKSLVALGVHKQIAGRILEPWAHINVVATATDWSNFFALRCNKMAMPEIQVLAVKMARAYRDSAPTPLEMGWWHLPYVTEAELMTLCHRRWERSGEEAEESRLLKLSTARCARVSYKTFDGNKPDPEADIALHDRLLASGHWSPFEHAAMAIPDRRERSGNFTGWEQYRQTLARSVHAEFDFARLDEYGDRDFIV